MKKSRFREEQMWDDPRLVRREPNGRHSPVISGPKKPGRSPVFEERGDVVETRYRYPV